VPGLVIAQHGGGGKAEQIFLRGFDADHGTDVAVTVDGVPVNMVSHAHGQGYADLHFLMPEVVERVDARKGPFDVRDGDFATAGAVAFHTRDRLDAPVLTLRGGSFGSRDLVALAPIGGSATRSGGYVAAAVHGSAGPFDAPQDHRRVNAYAKWTAPVGRAAEVVVSGSTFGARWDASGQVPDRAVRAGAISRFGSIDPSEGGSTSRHDVRVALRPREAGDRAWEASAFATRYRFGLFSNFTFFRADSVNGDGIEQVDDRVVAGASASYRGLARLGGASGAWSAGAGTRVDDGSVGLHHQQARTRLATRVAVDVRQAHLYQWARYELVLGGRVRADVGLRADLFRFGVTDRVPGGAHAGADVPRASGTQWQGIVSPRANLAVDVGGGAMLYANAGSGFHSNDARDAVLATRGERILPRAVSAELGARRTWAGGSVAAALWALDLESELVYVGDEGVTEPSGRSRRAGVDVEARVRITPWLWADADLNVARGRFRDEPVGASRIPLAPGRTAVAGLTVRDVGRAGGGLRVRHVGGRPAVEDNSVRARGYTVGELVASYRLARARVYGTVDNLFGVDWNEAQFATTSRLRGERAEVTELHYTPGAPRNVQLGLEYRF
jgi:outer membrane receptor protein involved in Fe transport